MFSKRLNILLLDNDISQTTLAKEIGFSAQAVNRWCRGETEPDYSTLLKIAKYFNVSTDFLLGNDTRLSNIELQLREKIVLKDFLVKYGYMSNEDDLTDTELEHLLNFINTNKEFIKNMK